MTTKKKATATSFPEEVVMEILSRLPVKSLLRFRCVSKTWFQLLTIDIHFTQLHLDKSINSNSNYITNSSSSSIILVGEQQRKIRFYYIEDYNSCNNSAIELGLPFTGEEEEFCLPRDLVCQSGCNGLLMLRNDDIPIVCVWNPLTREHINISLTSKISKTWTTVYGFGFQQGIKEFKVLQISSPISSTQIMSQVRVYSLGKGLWRTLEDLPYKICISWNPVVLVRGALYLFLARLESYSYNVLVSFDLEDEVFHEIQQPDGLCYNFYRPKLGELDGLLCLYSLSRDQLDFQVWVMDKYGVADSWTELYKINLQLLAPQPLDYLTLLGVAKNKELILKFCRAILLYNPQTNSVRRQITEFPVFEAYLYKGSLVSPKLINEVRQIAGGV